MKKKRILIVEDEIIIAASLRSCLEHLGYDVAGIVTSGEKTVAVAEATRPDLILMDIMLKGRLDGIETSEQLKSVLDIPVVYLSAFSDERVLERAKKTDPFGFLVKPFNDRELRTTIETAIHKHKRESQLKEMALLDSLTGLPNRTLLIDRFNQALALAKRDVHRVAVLFLDLDDFKCINDKLGHQAGDVVLKETALRVAYCLRGSDTVARIGGDEFVIVLTRLATRFDAEVVASKIVEAFGEPFFLKEEECFVGISIGISIFPDDGDDSETLLKYADIAMYQVKHGSKNGYRFYRE